MFLEDFDDKYYVIVNGTVSVQSAGLYKSGSLAPSQMSNTGMMWNTMGRLSNNGN
jgi:hypothetical protein